MLTTGGSSVVLDGSALAVESVVGCAVKASLAGAVELAAAQLAEDGGSQLGGCASGEHGEGVFVYSRVVRFLSLHQLR